MPEPATDQPVHLRSDGKVQIGSFTFDVNNVRTDSIVNDTIHGEQTVQLTLVLTRPLNVGK